MIQEAEFAFKMKRDLPPRPDPYSQGEVMAAVDTLHLAIEVPDSRYDDFVTIGAPSLVADDSCAAYFVLGPEAPNWRSIDLPSHKVMARKNGTDVAEGSGANVLGDPRAALAWIANDLQGRGVGRTLMQRAEAYARRKGCAIMHLDTLSFQARGFYEKLGYTVYGTITGFPNGSERYYLVKYLDVPSSAGGDA